MGVVVSEIHTGAGGEQKCLSWEELTCLKGDIAAIQKVTQAPAKSSPSLFSFRGSSVFSPPKREGRREGLLKLNRVSRCPFFFVVLVRVFPRTLAVAKHVTRKNR